MLSILLSLVLGLSHTKNTTERDIVQGPAAINSDFPDPSIIWAENLWFAFATNGKGENVQVATSLDFITWTLTDQDALPVVGAWVDSSNPVVWAPMVIQVADGSFVMYYTATSSKYSPQHCIGVATSTTVRGPYTPQADAFVCRPDLSGVLDPAGHHHPDGSFYVVYGINGLSLGHGGLCNNAVPPIPTPIKLQQVAADGFTKIGPEVQILDRDVGNGPSISAPSLVYVEGVWFLFFSSACNMDTTYDLSYATAHAVTGPYTKAGSPNAPLLFTGIHGLKAPGSACFVADGSKMVFSAWLGNDIGGGRGMWTGIPSISGTNVTLILSPSTPSETGSSSVHPLSSTSGSTPPAFGTGSSLPQSSSSPNGHHSSAGAIAGGVAGSIAAIASLVAFVIWQRQRSIPASVGTQFITPLPILSTSPTTTQPSQASSSDARLRSPYNGRYVSGIMAQVGDYTKAGQHELAKELRSSTTTAMMASQPVNSNRRISNTIEEAQPPQYHA
ncbi:hypothetical protein DXG01_011743 [Tephrocybe rancida]|nr:hypothetical protein DXG01_011743 [Tephrocybe rancida]